MKKVLIVDDEITIRTLLSAVISCKSETPCKVILAQNGSEAIELARKERPDLVLLDVVMPDGPDGFEVCRYIKSNPATYHACVIMMSGYSPRCYFEDAIAMGADDFLCKPFDLPGFQTKISNVLNDVSSPQKQRIQ